MFKKSGLIVVVCALPGVALAGVALAAGPDDPQGTPPGVAAEAAAADGRAVVF